jgi:hypothetical protein
LCVIFRADFGLSQLAGYGSVAVVGKDTLFPVEVSPSQIRERQISGEVFMAGLRPENNRWGSRYFLLFFHATS